MYTAANELNASRSFVTEDSVWDDGIESERRLGSLVRLNGSLIDGYRNLLRKDLNGLVHSYEEALRSIPVSNAYADMENYITVKSNLSIALYYAGDVSQANTHLEDAYVRLTSSKISLQKQTENLQSLYIKILCNMIVFKMVKKEDTDCKAKAAEMVTFLNSVQDNRKKKLFIKEAIYILFRLESLSSITQEYIDKTSQ